MHTATLLADGRVLVAGGYIWYADAPLDPDTPLASASVYDPPTNTFRPTGSMADARGLYTATLLSDGRVLIAGGGPVSWLPAGPYLISAELYDPTTGKFSPTGSMAAARSSPTATRLADGRVLITGGQDSQEDQAFASAELYDPTTGKFSATGSMAAARVFHTATLLEDGRVLVVGGDNGGWRGPFNASAEIYDPTTGIFSPASSMTTARGFHTATLLSDGRVLITGGEDGVGDLASAELYDPTSGTFSATGSMTVERNLHTATMLVDGRVLVVGGGGDYANGNFLASAEIYDPTTGTFTLTGPMAEMRISHTANLLTDGRVLVTGGFGRLAPLASAEIYDPTTSTFSPAGLQPQAAVRCADTPNAAPSATVQWSRGVPMGAEPTITAGQAVAFVTIGAAPTVTEWINGTPAASPCIDKVIGSDTNNGMSVVVTFYQPGDYDIECRVIPLEMHTVVHVVE